MPQQPVEQADDDEIDDDRYDDDEDDDDTPGIVAPPVVTPARIESDGDTRGRAEGLGEGVEQHV